MNTRRESIANLRSTWSSLDAVVGSLSPEQWQSQSLCPDWTSFGVLVHVAAIEEILIGWPPGGEAPFARMAPTVREMSALPPDELVARYRRVVAQRGDELEAMTDDDFATMGPTPVGPNPYGRFMDIRTFDVWVHERDIRVPLAIPGDDSGPAAELSLDEVHQSLGYIVGKKVGLESGKSVAFDITGPVKRQMFVRVDGRAAVVDALPDPDATVSTDSLTFMLLACGRIDPEVPIADGRVTWTGDDDVAGRVARNLRFTI
jgi:uncharacterized protein (TIGR03083 family)